MKKLLFGITLCLLACASLQGAESKKKRWSFSRKKKTSKVVLAQSKEAQQPPSGLEYVTREEFDLLQKQFQKLQQQQEAAGQDVEQASLMIEFLQRKIVGFTGEVKKALSSLMREKDTLIESQADVLAALAARVQMMETKQEKLEMRVQDGFVVVNRCGENSGEEDGESTSSNEG